MKDGGYTILQSGDTLTLKLRADTERAIFERALLGLASLEHHGLEAKKSKTLAVRAHVHGANIADTFERFLKLVIFEGEMHDAIFSAMHLIEFSEREVECELLGKKIEHREENIHDILVRVPPVRLKGGEWEAEIALEIL